jgi:hypothetical protein
MTGGVTPYWRTFWRSLPATPVAAGEGHGPAELVGLQHPEAAVLHAGRVIDGDDGGIAVEGGEGSVTSRSVPWP